MAETSACCDASGTAGCDDAPVQAAVCAADSYCCDVQWDALCAQEAVDFGGASCSE